MAVVPSDNELHRVAVTGIIWKEEGGARKYLITKRAPTKKAWPNKWTVPGGGLMVSDYSNTPPTHDVDEAPQWYGAVEVALRREIKEEVNLEVGDAHYLLDVAALRPDGTAVLVLSFYCEYARGEVALDADATECAWVTAAEVGNYDLIKGIDDEIRMVEERLAARKDIKND
jgi:8-oxo-dGTP pyrophosphatase MutT (NUDIX family)